MLPYAESFCHVNELTMRWTQRMGMLWRLRRGAVGAGSRPAGQLLGGKLPRERLRSYFDSNIYNGKKEGVLLDPNEGNCSRKRMQIWRGNFLFINTFLLFIIFCVRAYRTLVSKGSLIAFNEVAQETIITPSP